MNEVIGSKIIEYRIVHDGLDEPFKAVLTLDNGKTLIFESVMVDYEECGLDITIESDN